MQLQQSMEDASAATFCMVPFVGHTALGPKTVTVIPETEDLKNQTLAAYQDPQVC